MKSNVLNNNSSHESSHESSHHLNNIRVVLMHTSHPGNIGSAARAMKTMGLGDLCLVSPKFFPHEQATAMSSNAKDLLNSATVVNSLQEAIKDCHLVIGSSARQKRSLRWDVLDSRQCGEIVYKRSGQGSVALVFGRERSGLTNDELALCHHLVHIPANPDYSSLNVASAVQILAYECRVAMHLDNGLDMFEGEEFVTSEDMQRYYDQLELIMMSSGFLDPDEPRHLMPRLRRMYGRIKMTRSELNILRGMLSSFQKHAGRS